MSRTHRYDPGTPRGVRLSGRYQDGRFAVASFREPGTAYTVDLAAKTCSCPHYAKRIAGTRGACKHVKAAREESGRIALYICRQLALANLERQARRTDLRPEIQDAVRMALWERTTGAAIINALRQYGDLACIG